jgi:hypothetical protein
MSVDEAIAGACAAAGLASADLANAFHLANTVSMQ